MSFLNEAEARGPHDTAELKEIAVNIKSKFEEFNVMGAVTQINPGAAQRGDWAKVSFKGGSEVGVLSAASLLTAKDGTVYCVAAAWNSGEALDQTSVIGSYGSVLHKLAGN